MATSAPDKNDWIEDCTSQALVYTEVTKAISLFPNDALSVEAVERLAENAEGREILSHRCHTNESRGVEVPQSTELLMS